MISYSAPSFDVCIIGAGPSGCVAAFHLARAGFNVLMLEEHSVVGKPVDCSGIIGNEAFEKLDLPRESIRNALQAIEFVSPSGKRMHFNPQRTMAHVVDRAEFDQCLADRAGQAGASCWVNALVTRVETSDTGVALSVVHEGEATIIHARAVVLAGGPRYQFQEFLGMGSPTKYLRTVQAEVEVAQPDIPKVFLGSRIAAGSFAWWLPVKARTGYRAKIGVSATIQSQRAFKAFLRLLDVSGHLNGERVQSRSWMIPIAPLRKTYGRRVVAVGDAAGQTKPTTGGGLYYGLLCATLAAEVIGEGFRRGDLSERFLSGYEQSWQRILGRELSTAQCFRVLFEQLTDEDIDGLFDLALQDGILSHLEEQADFDWHRHAILQAIRRPSLARILLRGLGQYQLARLFS